MRDRNKTRHFAVVVGGQEMGLKLITLQQLLSRKYFVGGGLEKVWMWISTAQWKYNALYGDISAE
jgi:hypothetical protein